MKNIFFVILFLFARTAFSQVEGFVKENGTDKPIRDAVIFVNKSSLSAHTAEEGQFSLQGILPGFVEVIVWKKGYKIFRSPLRIQEGKGFRLTLKLIPDAEHKINNQIPVKEKAPYLAKLAKTVLGTGADVSQCRITNPDAISFYKGGDTTKVITDAPIQIVNMATGYSISFYPDDAERRLELLLSSMVFRFDTLKESSQDQLNKWKVRRNEEFFGSRRHFFSALANRVVKRQGFKLFDEAGTALIQDSILNPQPVMGYTVVNVKKKTKIVYELPGAGSPQVSWFTAPDGFAINKEGLPLNEKSVSLEGAMATDGLAGLLPSNFYPTTSVDEKLDALDVIKQLQEKIYVQTDKPYYYPGEPMWYKGYVSYYEKQLRDTLSRVAYFEIIDASGKLKVTHVLKIRKGTFNNDWIIPDTLKPGNYQLRAYTNLMRNFNKDAIFSKTFRIVDPKAKVDPYAGAEHFKSSPGISVQPDKTRYRPHQKITLKVTLADASKVPVSGDLSMSVTDALQVVPVPSLRSIVNGFEFDKSREDQAPAELPYAMEKGIDFTIQFLNDKKKKESALIRISKGYFDDKIQVVADAEGQVKETNYQFYDTLKLYVTALDEKDRIYGSVSLLPRAIEPTAPIDTLAPFHLISTNVRQRIVSDLEVPRDVQVLQTVEVGARSLKASEFTTKKYGQPSRIYSGKKFQGTDMLNSLMAAIPQLKTVNYMDGSVTRQALMFGHFQYGTKPTAEPLIYVNGGYRGGGTIGQSQSAIAALATLNPDNIDQVEIIDSTSPNTAIFLEGGSGLISIVMKAQPLKGLTTLAIVGYKKSRAFQSPAYPDPAKASSGDFRSTIFWEPELDVPASGTSYVSFYAADVPGKYHVVVEGVTSAGIPVTSESYITVGD